MPKWLGLLCRGDSEKWVILNFTLYQNWRPQSATNTVTLLCCTAEQTFSHRPKCLQRLSHSMLSDPRIIWLSSAGSLRNAHPDPSLSECYILALSENWSVWRNGIPCWADPALTGRGLQVTHDHPKTCLQKGLRKRSHKQKRHLPFKSTYIMPP